MYAYIGCRPSALCEYVSLALLPSLQGRNVTITVALYGDIENARGAEDAVGNVLKRERDQSEAGQYRPQPLQSRI